MKKYCPVFLTLFCVVLISFVSPKIHAAAPDGSGPWADQVVSTAQGLTKNGSAIPASRSDATTALGVAEGTIAEGTFYSLGFGGKIVLKFDNPVTGGVMVIESTNPGYPQEKALIEVSKDGSTWVSAGSVTQTGQVNLPKNVSCAAYVRITDTSNKNDFSDEMSDGYDVDGVKTTGTKPCKDGSGNGGDTTVIIDQKNTCIVNQSNTLNAVTVQGGSSNTGKNKVKKNTGGKNSVKTGEATVTNTAKTTGGDNISAGCGCCDNGSTTVTVQ